MFTTKDSGKRMSFDSGMVRDTQEGKTLYHLIFSGPMLERWAGLLTRGAAKYNEDNWMKAEGQAEYRRFKASAARHFVQWMRGDTDEDHAAAVFFNLNGAEYVKGKLEAAGHTAVPILSDARPSKRTRRRQSRSMATCSKASRWRKSRGRTTRTSYSRHRRR
jgi:hypothetical protein